MLHDLLCYDYKYNFYKQLETFLRSGLYNIFMLTVIRLQQNGRNSVPPNKSAPEWKHL